MNSETLISQDDLFDNPTTRVPVCLCLDISGSMAGAPIEELNEGILQFYEAICSDEIASYSAEIAIVVFGSFGDKKVQCVQPFMTLSENPEPPVLTAKGCTPIGEGVNMALDLLEKRKQDYITAGVDYHQPWLLLMTDGAPIGSDAQEQERAQRRIQQLLAQRKLVVFPLGVGKAKMENLQKYASEDMPPMKLKGLRFRDFFRWLSQSVVQVSSTMAGEPFRVDISELAELTETDGDWDF